MGQRASAERARDGGVGSVGYPRDVRDRGSSHVPWSVVHRCAKLRSFRVSERAAAFKAGLTTAQVGEPRHARPGYCLTAIAEISTFAPPIKPATCTVARAGFGSGISFL